MKKIFGMISVVFTILLSIVNIQAQTPDFTDNHGDGSLSGWTSQGSRTWSEAGGFALPQNNTANTGFLICNYNASADGVIETDIKADQWNGHSGGIVLRWTSAQSYYFVTVKPGNQWDNYIKFCKNSMNPENGTTVASGFVMNTAFTLRIEISGPLFKFYIDGVLKGQITDAANLSGKFGYAYGTAWNQYVSFSETRWWNASLPQYLLTVSKSGNGNVTPQSGNYQSGTEVEITAQPSEGSVFSHWSGDLSGMVNPAIVTMNSAKSVVAHFVQITHVLTTTVSGNGTVSPGSGEYPHGTAVSITAIADNGSVFSHWSGDLSGSVNPESVVMNSAKSVTAHFTEQLCTLTVIAGSNGSVTPQDTVVPIGSSVTVTATGNAGFIFDHWTGGVSGIQNPLVIVMNSNKEITALFKADAPQNYTLVTSVAGNGSVAPESGTFTAGSSVILTATAESGWIFDHWEGSLQGAKNPDTLIVNSNKNIKAVFKLDVPIVSNCKKIAITAELFDVNGVPVGSGTPDTVDIVVKLADAQAGGNILYTENFESADGHGIVVDNGYMVARMGEGTATGNLSLVIAENNNLWIEISIGSEVLPRSPLTASAYSLK